MIIEGIQEEKNNLEIALRDRHGVFNDARILTLINRLQNAINQARFEESKLRARIDFLEGKLK